MKEEGISNKQGIILIIMFISGTTSLKVIGIDAKGNFWISIIISILITIPIAIIYGRLYYLFPGKNLFEILEICLGNFISKILMVFLAYFFLEEGTFVLLNFSHFINTTILDATPKLIIIMSFMLVSTIAIKCGIKKLGKWAEVTFLGFIMFISISIVISFTSIDLNNFNFDLSDGFRPILKGAFMSFTFPFGEILAFTMVFSTFKNKKSGLKVYLLGLFFGGLVIFLMSTTCFLILGVNVTSKYFHPAYFTMRRLHVTDVFQRLEVILSSAYMFGAFIKITIYTMAATKSIAQILNFKDYKYLTLPTVIFMMFFSSYVFGGPHDYWEYNNDIWPIYTFFFEMILPIIIIIIIEIKVRVRQNTV